MVLPSSDKMRALGRLVTDEDKQWLGVLEYARRNPTKDVEIFAINVEERDRIRARLHSLNGEAALPGRIQVAVKPDDHNRGIPVRVD